MGFIGSSWEDYTSSRLIRIKHEVIIHSFIHIILAWSRAIKLVLLFSKFLPWTSERDSKVFGDLEGIFSHLFLIYFCSYFYVENIHVLLWAKSLSFSTVFTLHFFNAYYLHYVSICLFEDLCAKSVDLVFKAYMLGVSTNVYFLDLHDKVQIFVCNPYISCI